MKRLTYILLAVPLCLYLALHIREAKPHATILPEPSARCDTVRLVFGGDLMQHMPQVSAARRSDGRYDYRESFRHVARYCREADLAIVNLETTLSDEGPYSGYPCFRSPSAVADAMRDMNIDLAVMANNHC